MKERIITAIGLIGAVALALFLGKEAIMVLISVVLVLAAYEVYLVRKGHVAPIMIPIYIALVIGSVFIPLEWGLVYLSLVFILLFVLAIAFEWFTVKELSYSFMMLALMVTTVTGLRAILNQGVLVLLYIMIATFLTDTFAYLGGMKFGKNKLIPRISPNKTVEGAISGYLAGVLVSFLFAYFLLMDQLGLNIILMGSLLIPLVSQLGDLSFSLIKRNYGIKDFGSIFPGHGGALDRIDSLVFAVLTFQIVLTLFL